MRRIVNANVAKSAKENLNKISSIVFEFFPIVPLVPLGLLPPIPHYISPIHHLVKVLYLFIIMYDNKDSFYKYSFYLI